MSTTVRAETEPFRKPDQQIQQVIDNMEKVIVGKRSVIELCLTGLIARGHVLLEDVPGVGKTLLVRSLAKSLACQFKRIQFTPDLLPSDVTGTEIYNQRINDFEFRPGPVFTQILLADEINRTSPKTQASLLEALEEKSVTADGVTYPLPTPFFVLATQNPIEYEGTFSLPEAQLDRFLMKLSMGYPTPEEEIQVLRRGTTGATIDQLTPVASPEDILFWQHEAMSVLVDDSLYAYVVQIVNQTRHHPHVYLGVSTRGAVAMTKAVQAYALVQGRDYVIPDDVKLLSPWVLSHRIIMETDATYQNITPHNIIQDILANTPVPVLPQRR